jgi:CRISPR-associated protein Cmr3
MKTWLLTPRDTLVIRDGRPIQEGAPPMRSLDLPWPSTLAGLVRTRIGTNAEGKFDRESDDVLRISVRGPLLAELDSQGAMTRYLVPAPRDCLWHRPTEENDEHAGQLARFRLTPQPTPAGCVTDLGDRQLVGFDGQTPRSKPADDVPLFWYWDDFQNWLLKPQAPDTVEWLPPNFGRRALPHERRTHVVIEPGSQTAKEGQIFDTDGLRFSLRRDGREEHLAITLACDDPGLRGGAVLCGGERRLSYLRGVDKPWPACPDELSLGSERLARVILLTPALFNERYAPDTLGGAPVVACAVPRAEVISGWDLARGGAKPTRRMAPAGSVYWVRLEPKQDARAWVRDMWMQCVSDKEQDRRDGFGLCVVGRA